MSKNKILSGKLIFWFLLVIFLWVAVAHFAQTKQIVEVLTSGNLYFVALAVACQIVYYPLYTQFMHYVYRIFDVHFSRKSIFLTYLASKFTDVALPVATLGQVAVFVRNGKRNNVSPLSAGVGVLFALLLEVSSFLAVAIVALFFITLFSEPPAYLTAVSLILAVVVSVIILFVTRITVSDQPLNRAFLWLVRSVARLVGQGSVSMNKVNEIILEVGSNLRKNQDKIAPGFAFAVITHLVNIVTLAFIYVAFAGDFNILAILAGYIACLLFTIVSITPQGVGVAETVMISTLHFFGLDVPTAAVITLAFRGLLYWLPLFPGFYVFSHLELKADEN